MIYIPKREIIVPVRRPIAASPGYRGRYRIEAVNQGDGRRRVLADWFPNLITNGGLDMIGNGQSYLTACAVGSGNTAPAVTDTALNTLVASTTSTIAGGSSSGVQSTAPYYGYVVNQYNFPAGTATGNLSEVGVGTSATALFSRALILDGTGSPTTITVLSTESLYVTYEVEQVVPTTDVTGTVTIAGVVYNYTIRAANATQVFWSGSLNGDAPGVSACVVSNGTIGAITGTISGTTAGATSIAVSAYTNGSYSLESTITFGLTDGNVAGGITAMSCQFGRAFGNGERGFFQYGFSPAIPKDGSHTLTLSVNQTWSAP